MKRISTLPSTIAISVILFTSLFFTACAGPNSAGGAPRQMTQGEFIFNTIWFLFVGLCVYYLIVIQPELKKEDAQKKFISGLKRGDDVVTSGGLLGKVQQVQDEVVTVEIAANVRVRVQASHVKAISAEPGKDSKASNS